MQISGTGQPTSHLIYLASQWEIHLRGGALLNEWYDTTLRLSSGIHIQNMSQASYVYFSTHCEHNEKCQHWLRESLLPGIQNNSRPSTSHGLLSSVCSPPQQGLLTAHTPGGKYDSSGDICAGSGYKGWDNHYVDWRNSSNCQGSELFSSEAAASCPTCCTSGLSKGILESSWNLCCLVQKTIPQSQAKQPI